MYPHLSLYLTRYITLYLMWQASGARAAAGLRHTSSTIFGESGRHTLCTPWVP